MSASTLKTKKTSEKPEKFKPVFPDNPPIRLVDTSELNDAVYRTANADINEIRRSGERDCQKVWDRFRNNVHRYEAPNAAIIEAQSRCEAIRADIKAKVTARLDRIQKDLSMSGNVLNLSR